MNPWLRFALFAAALVAAPAAVRAQPAPGEFRIHAIDVGTGLSIFVEASDFTLLYDAGSRDDKSRQPNNRVLAYLRAVRPDLAAIDHLILSHPHEDHVELMDDVLSAYQVRHVWDSGSVNASCGYRAFLDAVAAEPDVVYHNALDGPGTHSVSFPAASNCHGRPRPGGAVTIRRGSRISPPMEVPLGAGAEMMILHANGNARAGALNDATVVVRLDLGARRILLAGDAEAGGRRPPSVAPSPGSIEGHLLADHPAELRADVLVVGHHGSMTSSRVAFLDAVGANQFIISSGPFRYQGVVLPDAEVRDELQRRGTLWRTDRDDPACRTNPAKIGRDNDGRVGGCDNVRLDVRADGAIIAGYNRIAD